jgi:hypothetical protein
LAGALTAFLSKNTVGASPTMPAIHTTSAYNAKHIIHGSLIKPQPCDTFKGEELTYLFYGRPSYKKIGESQIAQYWELPSLFVMDYDLISAKRIYPFDTGAFQNYPNFISMMPMHEFEVTGTLNAPQRLVGAFFVNPDRYFRLRPRDPRDFNGRYEVTATDEEIQALHHLALSYSDRIDDRRFAIEIQTEAEIKLRDCGLKAVIIPEEYCESDELVKAVESHGAQIIPYPTYSLKQEMYYHSIYNILFELYREMGLVR